MLLAEALKLVTLKGKIEGRLEMVEMALCVWTRRGNSGTWRQMHLFILVRELRELKVALLNSLINYTFVYTYIIYITLLLHLPPLPALPALPAIPPLPALFPSCP